MHRHNAAERDISTFKDPFITVLLEMEPDFPIQNWDHLLEQSYITLNVIRLSRLNQILQAYTQLNGEFDFNRAPTAPPGTRNIVHNNTHNIGTWSPHEKQWIVR